MPEDMKVLFDCDLIYNEDSIQFWLMRGCCFLIVIVLENPCDGHVNLCSEFSEDMAAG
jgi:hypothetical protein